MKRNWLIIICCCLSSSIWAQDSIYYRAAAWNKKITEFKAEDAQRNKSKHPILFIGSSSFTRWNTLRSYFPEYNVLNRGFGASVTADLIYYAEDIIFPNKPRQILIYEGDNDLGGDITVADFITDIKTLVRLIEIKLPGVPVAILSIKASPKRDHLRQKYEAANVKLYEFAQSKKQLSFIDVASLMIDRHGNYRRDLYAEDMLHVNESAYKLWAHRIRPYLLTQDN